MPQQSKSSKIVSLFKVIIHKRCVLSEEKKKWSGLQKIQKKRGGDVKYIKKHNSVHEFVCDYAKITKQQISGQDSSERDPLRKMLSLLNQYFLCVRIISLFY